MLHITSTSLVLIAQSNPVERVQIYQTIGMVLTVLAAAACLAVVAKAMTKDRKPTWLKEHGHH
jgi:hypothetical protein